MDVKLKYFLNLEFFNISRWSFECSEVCATWSSEFWVKKLPKHKILRYLLVSDISIKYVWYNALNSVYTCIFLVMYASTWCDRLSTVSVNIPQYGRCLKCITGKPLSQKVTSLWVMIITTINVRNDAYIFIIILAIIILIAQELFLYFIFTNLADYLADLKTVYAVLDLRHFKSTRKYVFNWSIRYIFSISFVAIFIQTIDKQLHCVDCIYIYKVAAVYIYLIYYTKSFFLLIFNCN